MPVIADADPGPFRPGIAGSAFTPGSATYVCQYGKGTLKAEFDAENAKALETLVKTHGVQLRKFDDSILRTIGKISEAMLAEIGDGDALIRRVYQSFLKFRKSAMKKGEVTQSAYLHARGLAVPVGE